jgi:MFS family permease
MLVARIVSGIGMGFVNSTVPVIQAEFSPKSSRGRFVCMQLSTLNFGGSRLGIPGFYLLLQD